MAAVVLVANAEARKPNLVVIYTDDQGSIDINAARKAICAHICNWKNYFVERLIKESKA